MTARANRFIQEGYVYHLTSRCHDRTFLLKSAVWRNEYRRRLREALQLFDVWLLGMCITSNHIHLLVTAASTEAVALFMKKLQGEFGEYYNLQKRRHGGYWQDRYHCTMVQDGRHLWNCLAYVDLNMVRARAVRHPSEWEWSSYREHVGERKRYRLVHCGRLLELTRTRNMAEFERDYADAIAGLVACGGLRREPKWTQAIAVGDEEYVRDIAQKIRGRAVLKVAETADGAWTVCDSCADDPMGGATILRECRSGLILPHEQTLLGACAHCRDAWSEKRGGANLRLSAKNRGAGRANPRTGLALARSDPREQANARSRGGYPSCGFCWHFRYLFSNYGDKHKPMGWGVVNPAL